MSSFLTNSALEHCTIPIFAQFWSLRGEDFRDYGETLIFFMCDRQKGLERSILMTFLGIHEVIYLTPSKWRGMFLLTYLQNDIESFKTFCRNVRQKYFDCFIVDFLTNIFNFFTVIDIIKIAKLLSKQL